jgi:hypothetical protein
MSCILLLRPSPEQQCTVGAAEAERVRHGVFELGLAGLIGDEIHAAGFGVLANKVDGGRQDLIAQSQHRDARLEAAGASEQMPGHGLGGTDREFMFAEEVADRVRLKRIADRRGSSVGVDVIDFVGADAGVAGGVAHHAESAFVLGGGLRRQTFHNRRSRRG